MTNELITIGYYDGIIKAERMMSEKGIGCLPVMKDGTLSGIITSKDIRQMHPNRIVADTMTKKIISVNSDASLWKAKQILDKNSIERLLVVDNGELVGLITQKELLFELGKYIDPLTGLYRSDYIYHHGMELLNAGNEISIIFIDLNKFGVIDKEYGHTQGDIVLKELGQLLKRHMPSDAYLCRFGGDEFVVLTPYKHEKCRPLAETLIKAIAANVFSNNLTVSASAGISGGRRLETRAFNSMKSISELINLASLASTRAKKEKQSLVIEECYCPCEEIA